MPPRGAATRRAVGAQVVGEILARSEGPPERPSGVRGFAFGGTLARACTGRHTHVLDGGLCWPRRHEVRNT